MGSGLSYWYIRRDENHADLVDHREPERRSESLPETAQFIGGLYLHAQRKFLVRVSLHDCLDDGRVVKASHGNAHRLLFLRIVLSGIRGKDIVQVQAQRLLRYQRRTCSHHWRIALEFILADMEQIET